MSTAVPPPDRTTSDTATGAAPEAAKGPAATSPLAADRDTALTRRDVGARQRERFGGMKFGACFFGWLTATGMAVLLTALLAAAGAGVGLANNVDPTNPNAQQLQTVGVVGAIAILVIVLVSYFAGRYVAGAINFIGDATLYGRNWGCIEHHPFLHFEVCYYQAIDFAIARGLSRVEAGAQGEHKLARGYRPTLTRSAHDFADPGLRRAIADYLAREQRYVAAAADELSEAGPFRREQDPRCVEEE